MMDHFIAKLAAFAIFLAIVECGCLMSKRQRELKTIKACREFDEWMKSHGYDENGLIKQK